MLGISGDAAELVKAEDGSYWLGDMGVMSGSTTMSSNGNTYRLDMADGAWMATFVPMEMMIGGTGLTAMTREDQGGYDVAGSADMLPSTGVGEVTTRAGAMYRVRMEDGMLAGDRIDEPIDAETVYRTSGLGGNIDFTIAADDGAVSANDNDDRHALALSGDDASTANINESRTELLITVRDPRSLPDDDAFQTTESISMSDVLGRGSASKPATATGGPGEFVQEAQKMLTDLLEEAEIYARYQADAAAADKDEYDDALIRIAERAQAAVDLIFGPARDGLDATPTAGRACVICAGLPTETADAAGYVSAAGSVRRLRQLLDALSTQQKFTAATAKRENDLNGVFEDAFDGELDAFGESTNAAATYTANRSEFEAVFGSTENTRFGAIWRRERTKPDGEQVRISTATGDTQGLPVIGTGADTKRVAAALYDMNYAFDGEAGEASPTATADTDLADNGAGEDIGDIGAFAWAVDAETLRARRLPQTGSAVYNGETVAVTPGRALYSGDMRIDVNFRRSTVTGRVSELKDKDGSLWKYLDSAVSEIYLPRRFYDFEGKFGGSSDADRNNDEGRFNRDGTDQAIIVYANSHGFPRPTDAEETARFSGRFIGADGAEITGVWSLGSPVDGGTTATGGSPSDTRDIIYGSYGVERADVQGLPAVTVDESMGAATGVNSVVRGITGAAGAINLNNPQDSNDANFNFGDAFVPGSTQDDFEFKVKGAKVYVAAGEGPLPYEAISETHVARLLKDIATQRALLDVYATLPETTTAADVSNTARQQIWNTVNNLVREYLFALAAFTDSDSDNIPDSATNVEAPLGLTVYPRTVADFPDDTEAEQRLDALEAALSSAANLEAASKNYGGGIFDSGPWLQADATRAADSDTDPFPGKPIYDRAGAEFNLWSMSTDYTRFGVWYRQESLAANQDYINHSDRDGGGRKSPNTYAYSFLNQSSYRVDRIEQTYPASGRATYMGSVLSILNDRVYSGDTEVRVFWGITPASAGNPPVSEILPIFRNLRTVDTKDPLRVNGSQDSGAANAGVIVEEISFVASATLTGGDALLNVSHDAENGRLGLFDATNAANAITDATARLTLANRQADVLVASSAISAKFVGESQDGPLGIIGSWRIGNGTNAWQGTANGGYGNAVPDDIATIGGEAGYFNTLHGSFGADLESFETQLLP